LKLTLGVIKFGALFLVFLGPVGAIAATVITGSAGIALNQISSDSDQPVALIIPQ
jgi:hypothetical protein